MIKLKRVYDAESKEDGYRILVERLWPRGIKKENLKMDLWLKDAAPSSELRKWFSHDPVKWQEFQKRYHQELHANPDIVHQLKEIIKKHHVVTFLYSSKDEEYNNAVSLKNYLT